MWNWISENIEKIEPDNIRDIKRYYLYKIRKLNESIDNYCFCCEYDSNAMTCFDDACFNCPLIWGDIDSECSNVDSLHDIFIKNVKSKNYNAASNIAKQIANLPERKNAIFKLTKEQAIEEHRKMWNWIADNVENMQVTKVDYIKKYYMKVIRRIRVNIERDCFCCEYAKQQSPLQENICDYCPLDCNSKENNHIISEDLFDYFYSKCVSTGRYIQASNIARQIANLPERK